MIPPTIARNTKDRTTRDVDRGRDVSDVLISHQETGFQTLGDVHRVAVDDRREPRRFDGWHYATLIGFD